MMRSYLVVALAVLSAYSATANAATEQIRKPYQVIATQAACQYAGFCSLVFPPTTARTLIVRASCVFEVPDGGVVSRGQITVNQPVAPSVYIQPFAYPELPGIGATDWGTNNELNMVVDTGQSVLVAISTYYQVIPFLQCSLFGYTMD